MARSSFVSFWSRLSIKFRSCWIRYLETNNSSSAGEEAVPLFYLTLLPSGKLTYRSTYSFPFYVSTEFCAELLLLEPGLIVIRVSTKSCPNLFSFTPCNNTSGTTTFYFWPWNINILYGSLLLTWNWKKGQSNNIVLNSTPFPFRTWSSLSIL